MKFITIIHNDQKGLVAEISELLENKGINIERINARSQGETAEIRLVTSSYNDTLIFLNEAGYKAVPSENVLVRVEDRPGALARISRTLSENDVDIRGITMVEQHNGYNVVAITTDKDENARRVLQDVLVG